MMSTQSFSNLAPNMKTGDIILFDGPYGFSKVIEKLEDCDYSHVGMVVRLPEYDSPLLWEATSLTNLEDVEYHDHVAGPKLVVLEERLKTYAKELPEPHDPPKFAYRKLEVSRTPEMIDALHTLFKKEHGIPDPGEWKMIFEVIEGRYFNIPSKLDNFFCSELVAETYIKMNLLPSHIVPNAYMPKDFSDKGTLDLRSGALKQEIIMTI